ncbi:MAG: hypothetical protein HKN09_11300 [Saprospiraceae bacterium]|nr:hypothetical protein [Saprospiraceae bacterium]
MLPKLYVLFVLAFVMFACTNPSPEVEKEEYYLKIAYNVSIGEASDNYEIFTMDLYGKNRINITNHPAVDWAYYSYKDKIYFLSDRDQASRHFNLYECNTSGGELRKVSDLRLKDSWFSSRKEGSEFVVTPHESVDSAFYIIDKKGTLIKKIYPGLPYFNDPHFSPDGTQIVFRGANRPFKKDPDYIDELFIINEDGSGLRQLTHYPASDTTSEWHNYHAGPPQWNKDSTISYISKQNNNYSIFTIPASGGEPTQVTPDGFNQGWHNWSDDKGLLVFDGSKVAGDKNYDIFIMDGAKRTISRLTFDSIYEQAPIFIKEKLSLKQ